MLDGTGDLIKKLTRSPEPPSFWYSAMFIALAILLSNYLTSILLGEFYLYRNGKGVNFLVQIWLVGQTLAGVIAGKIYVGILFRTLHDDLLDAIESVSDLGDLQHWLSAFGNVKKQLFFSLAFSILVSVYTLIFFAANGYFIGFGPTIFGLIIFFQGGMIFFLFYLFLPFPVRLSRYQFKLNPVNPSSSEVIDRLSDTLTSFVYIAAIPLALATLFLLVFELANTSNIILVVLVGWGPLIALFLTNQYALSRIIIRAKWKKLNEIQAKIESLEASEDIPGEKTLAHMTKLIDYYDRIKMTPNSALNLRAGLSFLNSLLLPLLAFILGNLDQIEAWTSWW